MQLRSQLVDGSRRDRMAESSRERACGRQARHIRRVTAEPCAAALKACADDQALLRRHEQRARARIPAHAAASDAGAKRSRYESCPSPLPARPARRSGASRRVTPCSVSRGSVSAAAMVAAAAQPQQPGPCCSPRCRRQRGRWRPRPRSARRIHWTLPRPPRSLPRPKPRPTASRRLRPASRPSRPTARPIHPRPSRPRRSGLPRRASDSLLMSMRRPVSRAARRAFWPSLPMASDSW